MKKETFNLVALVVAVLLIVVIYIDYRNTNRYVPSQVSKHVVIDTKTGDYYFVNSSGAKKTSIKK